MSKTNVEENANAVKEEELTGNDITKPEDLNDEDLDNIAGGVIARKGTPPIYA